VRGQRFSQRPLLPPTRSLRHRFGDRMVHIKGLKGPSGEFGASGRVDVAGSAADVWSFVGACCCCWALLGGTGVGSEAGVPSHRRATRASNQLADSAFFWRAAAAVLRCCRQLAAAATLSSRLRQRPLTNTPPPRFLIHYTNSGRRAAAGVEQRGEALQGGGAQGEPKERPPGVCVCGGV